MAASRYADEKCVEIMMPLAAAAPPTTGGIAPPPALPSQPLKLTIRTSANPGRVGTPLSLFIFVENLGQQPQRDVSLRVQLPTGAVPDANRISPPGAFEFVGQQEIRFDRVGDIPAGQRREFEIPLTSSTPGIATFTALVNATGMTQPIVAESTPIQIEPAAQ